MERIVEVLDILEKKGYQAYLVGGYPRDYYLGKKTDDFDICTNAIPENLKMIFQDIIEENYGSLKVKYKDIIFEITTFRIETDYVSVRTPVITYAKSLKEDLVRRDFIMNTLCINSKGDYIDILQARKDLDNKVIQSVGDPFKKMGEDPLRILRAIRFATILNFKIEDTLSNAIYKNKDLVFGLSYYRKREELDKILLHENCQYGLSLIRKYELDEVLECNFDNLVFVPCLEAMWAQITYSSSYPFTKKEKKNIEKIKHFLSKKEINNLDLYYYGVEFFFYISKILGKDFKQLEERYHSLVIHSIKDIAVDVSLINNKYVPLLENAIINHEIENNVEGINSFLKNISNDYEIR